MNIDEVKTWKGAVEFTVDKYSTRRRWRALVDDCGFCEFNAQRKDVCSNCPVYPMPESRGCDSFWNCYLSRARVHEIFTAVLAKVKVFSARNIRAALIKELKPKEREIFIKR